MRFKFISAAIALIASPALAHPLSLNIDQSKPLILSRPATGVVVGNASIADVIVHDTKTIIVIYSLWNRNHIISRLTNRTDHKSIQEIALLTVLWTF